MKKKHIKIRTKWKHIFPDLVKVIVTRNPFFPPTERREGTGKGSGALEGSENMKKGEAFKSRVSSNSHSWLSLVGQNQN